MPHTFPSNVGFITFTMEWEDLDAGVQLLEPPQRAAAFKEQVLEARGAPQAPATFGPPPIAILGVPFDHVTQAQAMRRIEDMIQSGKPHYLVTANVDFLVQAQQDDELRRVLLDAHMVLCDGTPLLWASHWLGHPLPERVAGADLTPELLRRAAEKGYRVFFLGGKPDVAARAIANLKAQHPKLVIAGQYSPSFAPLPQMDHREIRRRIRQARPDLLLVSFGCPKAEKWMAMNYRSLGVPVMIGVGATIDFLAGQVKRAPVWMRHGGLEWLYRLAGEPRRLGPRYAADLRHFGWKLGRQWWTFRPRRESRREAPRARVITEERDWQLIEPPPRLDAAAAGSNAAVWGRALAKHCLLDLSGVREIDSAGVGLLLHLHKRLRANGRHLVLLMPGGAVEKAFAALRLESFFLTALDPLEARWRIAAREEQARGRITVPSAQPTLPWQWQGEITAANAAGAWRHLRRPLRALCARHRVVPVDLGNVRFLDSTGARVLLKAQEFAAQCQVELRYLHWRPAVGRAVCLAGLDRLFEPSAR